MTNNKSKPVVPVFKANRTGTEGWKIPVNIIDVSAMSNGSVTKRKAIIKPYLDCYKVDNSSLEISLDGTKFYTMERLKELIELGEQYEDLMKMKQDQYEDMNR